MNLRWIFLNLEKSSILSFVKFTDIWAILSFQSKSRVFWGFVFIQTIVFLMDLLRHLSQGLWKQTKVLNQIQWLLNKCLKIS